MAEEQKKKKQRPAQHQDPPGKQTNMKPRPDSGPPKATPRMQGKVALISGGDSGIGRAVAWAFAQEGCDVAISYLKEHADARKTQELVQGEGRKCMLIPGDLGDRKHCQQVARTTVKELGQIDVLVNNAGVQVPQDDFLKITEKQLLRTFSVNIFAAFHLTQAALKHMPKGSCIVNTASITAYRGSPHLVDYSATKGAMVAFTRSLSGALVDKGIRVNAVAPGPIWTPLIPSTFDEREVEKFGSDTPMKRAGEPGEVAPAYVFLASSDAAYITGQTIHVNGGEVVNG